MSKHLFVTLFVLSFGFVSQSSGEPFTSKQMREFASLLAKHSYRSIDTLTALNILTRSKLDSLDCYARLYDSKEWNQMQTDLAGSFGGIGVRVSETPESTGYRVIGIFVGSPAAEAGISEKDIVISVNGIAAASLGLDELIGHMRGKAGTSVSLVVHQWNTGRIDTVNLVRAVIETPSIRGAGRVAGGEWRYTLSDDTTVGYLRILYFTRTTANEFDQAMNRLQLTGAKSLIIDLRGNQGGLLKAALGIADQLLDTGLMIYAKDHAGTTDLSVATSGTTWTGAVAVLVDSVTVSSGEVLTAVLRYSKRAMIIGERTYGKSSIQQLFPLADSTGGISITTSIYYPSSGRQIERRFLPADSSGGGIPPDIHWSTRCTREMVRDASSYIEKSDIESDFAHREIPVLNSKDDCLIRVACEYLQKLQKR